MNCKRLNPKVVKVPDRGKRKVTDAARNPPRVGNGASSSGKLFYVPVVPLPTAAPSAEKHVDVPTPTIDAHAPVPPPTAETRVDVPPPAAAIPNDNATSAIPQPAATVQMPTQAMPTQAMPLSVPEVLPASLPSLASPVVVERSLEASASMTIPEAQEVAVLQQQHVHPSKNIQHGLDLWGQSL